MTRSLWSHAAALALAAPSAIGIFAPAAQPASAAQAESQPVTLVVNLARQRIDGYRGTKHFFSSAISSGKAGHRTPRGVFGIIQKRRRHFSNLYNGAPMPYMQRLTWSGIALHAGQIPGYPASHGCVRLPYSRAKQLFSKTHMNARVVVTTASPRPSVISHPLLWNRLPPGQPVQDDEAPRDGEGVPIVTGSVKRNAGDDRGAKAVQAVNALLGVRPAEARARDGSAPAQASVPGVERSLPDAPPRTQAEVAARYAKQLRKLDEDLKTAQTELEKAKANRDSKGLVLRAALLRKRKLAAEFRLIRRQHARWQKINRAAQTKLRVFLERNAKVPASDPRFTDLALRERQLAEAVVKAMDEIGIAETIVKEIKARTQDAEMKVLAAADAFKQAKAAFVTATKTARTAQAARDAKARDIKLFERPIHVLISRKAGTIRIRQGYNDILKAPVGFIDPEKPIGTHLLQAIGQSDDNMTLRWTALRVPDAANAPRATSRKGRKSQRRLSPPRPRLSVRAALNRVIIPKKVHQRIRELIKVGSSVLISDRAASHETGKGTDFVILTR